MIIETRQVKIPARLLAVFFFLLEKAEDQDQAGSDGFLTVVCTRQEMAVALKKNVRTVRRDTRELEELGHVVCSRRGRGNFYEVRCPNA